MSETPPEKPEESTSEPVAETAVETPADPSEPAAVPAAEPVMAAAAPAAATAATTVPPAAAPVGVPVWPGQPVPSQPASGVGGLGTWPPPLQPRPAPKPTAIQKHWQLPTGGAKRVTLSAILIAAIVGAMALVLNRPGFGFLVTGLAVAGAVAITARAVRGESRWSWRRNGERTVWTVITLALLAVGTFRDSGWLFFLCVVIALGTASVALTGGRSVLGLLLAPITWVGSIFASPVWFSRGVKDARRDRGGPRVVLAIVVSLGLLLVFGGLFAAADAEFAHVVASVLPKWTAADVTRAAFCFVVIFVLTVGATQLADTRPTYSEIKPGTWRAVRRVEWMLPLALLDLMFAVFVYIQLTVLFGNDKLDTKSHAYMKGYAHNGFWQLVTVSLLTLTVLAVTGRIASRATRTDRLLVRVLLGLLSIFSIVIVASALKRLGAYEHAYGFTRLRVVVGGFELWVGLVFLLVLLAGIKLKGSWLPQVIAGSFALALVAGAAANPDYYVASHNVQRYQDTGRFSVEYMSQLSADAVPAIEQLPPRLRDCSLADIAVRLADEPDDWRSWNFGRVDAREQIGTFDMNLAIDCPALVGKR